MSENKTDTQTPAEQVATPEAQPAPKLAEGLFKPFTLGSRLEQGSSGNVMSNLKASPMDYEKKYQNSTKNQSMTAEELAKLGSEPVKKSTDTTRVKVPGTGKVQIGGPSRKIGVTPKAANAAYGVKKSEGEDDVVYIPEEQFEEVMLELDRRLEEAKKSNDVELIDRINKAKKDAKYERCVMDVKHKQGGKEGPVNPWAVCHASLGKSEGTETE